MRSEPNPPSNDLPPGSRIQPADCSKHGPFEQKVILILGREMRIGCPECARIAQQERDESQRLQDAFAIRQAMERKLGASLIPKRFATKTFDTYTVEHAGQERVLAKCRAYAEAFPEHLSAGRCLLLLGKPGTGKTHLSAAIANHIMATSAATAVYRTIGTILHAIRSTYGGNGELTEAKIFAGLIEPTLLILDEVGASKEKPSDFELTTLFTIINGRYEQELPTIIVSNLGAKELPDAIGERCADRLREGGVIVLPFTWESQRGKEGF